METGPAPMRTHSATTSTKVDGFRRLEVITGVGRRRRWSDEDKARIVAKSLDPATTSSAVARRYGLHKNRSQIGSFDRSRAPGVRKLTDRASNPGLDVLMAGDIGGMSVKSKEALRCRTQFSTETR